MVLRCQIAASVVATVAACAATVAFGQERRKDLDVNVPSVGGSGTGKLIAHGGDKRDGRHVEAFRKPQSEEPELRGYGNALVTIGGRSTRIGPGKSRTLAIPAHPKKLQVWTIGGLNLLIGIEPGEVMTLRDGGSIALWYLSSARIDPSQARPPVVYCAEYEDDCREGFVDVVGASNDDPLCRGVAKSEATTKRCMIPGAIRVVAARDVRIAITDGDPGEEQKAWDAHAGEVSEYVAVSSGSLDYWSLDVGATSYLLVIGPGEKWTVKVKSDGTVSGVRD